MRSARAVILVAAGLVASASVAGASPAWQLDAIGESGVPGSVLLAAASIRIAIIDTGADLHIASIATKHPLTYNVFTRSRDVMDPDGHGTIVAALAASASGNAQLLVVKAASASGAVSDIVEAKAIRYAVDHGARIINLSVGGGSTSRIERAAVGYAVAHGVLLVAAAGNGYAASPEYPAALLGETGLAVAATTETGAHAPFSNTGPWVAVAAPGEGVDVGAPLGYAAGTSFAAPLVAGAAALVWGADPALTARQVVQLLEQTASGHGTRTDELGYGVIDVAAAVRAALSLKRS